MYTFAHARVRLHVCEHSSSFYFIAEETGGDVLSRPATGVSKGVRGKSVLSTTAYRIQPAAVGSMGGRGKPVLSTAGYRRPRGDSGTLSPEALEWSQAFNCACKAATALYKVEQP